MFCYEGLRRHGEEAIEAAAGVNVYFAGGYGIYKAALPLVDVMYITVIHMVVEDGDAFFPEFDAGDFDVTIGETCGDEIKYTRTVYRRKKLF